MIFFDHFPVSKYLAKHFKNCFPLFLVKLFAYITANMLNQQGFFIDNIQKLFIF